MATSRMTIVWAGPSGGGAAPPAGFTASLTGLFATPLEIGANLISPTFTASYSPVATETFAELSDDDGNPTQNIRGFPNPVTMPFTYTRTTIGGTVTWTLTANDGGPNDTDQVTATWLPAVYRGVDASAALSTEADIEGLATKALASDKTGTFIFSPVTQYIYIAFPQAYNPTSPFDFVVNGFPGGFILQASGVNVTANTPGAPALLYDLWRSTFQLTGTPNVTVVVN